MNLEEAMAELRRVEEHLSQVDRELDALRGEPCEKCCKHEGDKIIGLPGEAVVLVGGYEAVLCRACRNAWAIAVDESGHGLEYWKAKEHLSIAREHAKTSRGASVHLSTDAPVETLAAVERKLFQFAMKWIAGGTP